jgi:Na+-transporting methylmalonyl-CoA/oxaloacetate decarboxylase gamma subunit
VGIIEGIFNGLAMIFTIIGMAFKLLLILLVVWVISKVFKVVKGAVGAVKGNKASESGGRLEKSAQRQSLPAENVVYANQAPQSSDYVARGRMQNF